MSKWAEDDLGRLASIEIGGTPSRDIPRYWVVDSETGHPWVSIADLGPRYVHETKEQITDLGVRFSNAKHVPKGTLLMSFKLTIGRASIASCDLFTNEAIAAIIPHERKVDPDFLYYTLPPIARGSVTDTAIKGATLNKKKLNRLRIRFPININQQRRIAEILTTLDETIEQTEALIAKHQQIKVGLMHD
ncbi:MAG: restriction endonuclease subunit S, partial [Burkholderiales bacterium]